MKKNAARDTKVGTKQVSRAHHQARIDARKSGELPKYHPKGVKNLLSAVFGKKN